MGDLFRINQEVREEILSLGERMQALEQIEKKYQLMQEALRKSEEKFAVSFLKSPIPQAISTIEDGGYVDVNDAFATVIGLTREELLNHTSISAGVFTAELRALFLNEYQEKGFVENLEMQTQTYNGELRYGLLNSSKITINVNRHAIITHFWS